MLSRSPPHLHVLVSSVALGLSSAALTQTSSINPYLILLTFQPDPELFFFLTLAPILYKRVQYAGKYPAGCETNNIISENIQGDIR
jgi:hypothetical protein